MTKYDEITGDYIDGRDSDFFILDRRCKLHNVPSPVAYSQRGSSTFLYDRKHIDLHKIYSKEIIQKGVFNDKYRTLHLDEVSKVLLGTSKYTSQKENEAAETGKNAHLLPIQEQINYVKRDAELAMMLNIKNNSKD